VQNEWRSARYLAYMVTPAPVTDAIFRVFGTGCILFHDLLWENKYNNSMNNCFIKITTKCTYFL
jgi:hypothetical protein